jgi:hypothetical protein
VDLEAIKSKALEEEEELKKKLKPKPKPKSVGKNLSEPSYVTHGGRIVAPDDSSDSPRRSRMVSKRRRTAVYKSGSSSAKTQKFSKPAESVSQEVNIPDSITFAEPNHQL